MVHLKMVIPKSEVQGSRVKGLGFRVELLGLVYGHVLGLGNMSKHLSGGLLTGLRCFAAIGPMTPAIEVGFP